MGFLNVLNEYVCKIKKFVTKQAKTIKECGTISCLSVTILLGVIPLVLAAYIFTFQIVSFDYYEFYIDVNQPGPVHIINKKFLSLGLDSSVISEGFKHFNMTDPKLVKMIKHLSPAYLRIGGNPADQIIFCNTMKSENCTLKYGNSGFNESDVFILSDSDWLKLHKLATKASVDVIYDLNSLLRYENGSWNPENAEKMIQFSQDNALMLHWELGNEPNSYEYKYNTSVSATQLGLDYISLRNILNKFYLYKKYSYLVGPSTTRLRTKEIEEYFAKFLISGYGVISAITWHHYYFSGMNATPNEFLDPYVFNYLQTCIDTVKYIVKDFLELEKPIWLGETSSAWHAGAPGLSDRFIASFIWIDKLGLSALMGIDVVVRQSIFKGHYALLNDSYDPNPDWWLSILYNKLVSTSVIGIRGSGDEKIRLYAHCAKNSSLWKPDCSVVVFGVNLRDSIGFVKIKNLISDSRVFVYELTSGGSLYSQYVRLNGELLNLLPNLELPELKPKIIVKGVGDKVHWMSMPAYSIMFWVFTNTNVPACMVHE